MRRVEHKTKLRERRFKIEHSELQTPCLSGRQANSELQRGFTLIEIIIVIVILSIVSAITIKFLVDSLRIYTMTISQKTLFDEGKLAMERMVRDIRDAQAMAEPDAGETVSDVRITRTHATAQDAAGEAIRFVLSGTTLQKRKSNPSAMFIDLASNVSTFTATRGATAEITIVLILSLPSGENITLQTNVYPKNFPTDTTYKNFKNYWEDEEST